MGNENHKLLFYNIYITCIQIFRKHNHVLKNIYINVYEYIYIYSIIYVYIGHFLCILNIRISLRFKMF